MAFNAASERTRVSRAAASTRRPTATRKPSSAPSSASCCLFGDVWNVAGLAGSIDRAVTVASPSAVSGATSSTALMSESATVFAMRAARSGSADPTRTSRITVFCGIVTLIMRRSWIVLRSPSSSFATGSRTTADVASLANDSICACV